MRPGVGVTIRWQEIDALHSALHDPQGPMAACELPVHVTAVANAGESAVGSVARVIEAEQIAHIGSHRNVHQIVRARFNPRSRRSTTSSLNPVLSQRMEL